MTTRDDTQTLRFAFDAEASIWHADGPELPGPAGAIAVELYGGHGRLEAVVDRAIPARLLGIDIYTNNGPALDREANQALERVLGSDEARHLTETADKAAEVEIEADSGWIASQLEAHGRLPRVLDELASADDDTPDVLVGLLSLEAALYVAAAMRSAGLPSTAPLGYVQAAAALLPEATARHVAAAVPDDRVHEVTQLFANLAQTLGESPTTVLERGVDLAAWVQGWQQVLHDRATTLPGPLEALGDTLGEVRAALAASYRRLLTAVQAWSWGAPVRGSLAVAALRGVTADVDDLDRDQPAWQSVTTYGELADIGVEPGTTQARLAGPARLEIRTQVAEADARPGLWVRVYDRSGDLLALTELEDDDSYAPELGLHVALDLPPGRSPAEIDLTRRPTEPRDPSPSYHHEAAQQTARNALRLERLDRLADAAHTWQQTARHWTQLQAYSHARQALIQAANCLRRNGNTDEVISRQLREDAKQLRAARDADRRPEPPLLAELAYTDLAQGA